MNLTRIIGIMVVFIAVGTAACGGDGIGGNSVLEDLRERLERDAADEATDGYFSREVGYGYTELPYGEYRFEAVGFDYCEVDPGYDEWRAPGDDEFTVRITDDSRNFRIDCKTRNSDYSYNPDARLILRSYQPFR